MHSHLQIILAQSDWSRTEHVLADVYVLGNDIRLHPREGMHLEDEAKLKAAIRRGEQRFQAEGISWHEVCPPHRSFNQMKKISTTGNT